MSRSYRKIPKYSRNDTWAKRQASKKARKADLPDGGAYKRVYCSWNICDYPGTLLTDDDFKRVLEYGGVAAVIRGYTK
jgi:hypothetical protein